MYIELNEKGYFVQYHENKNDIVSENKDFVIETNRELYDLLKNKMPWYMDDVNFNDIYTAKDIDKFVEIIPELKESIEERNRADIDYLSIMTGVDL